MCIHVHIHEYVYLCLYVLANTETMSILLSSASAQRPEVQELRHSTEVTFSENIMYTATLSQVKRDVHTRAYT